MRLFAAKIALGPVLLLQGRRVRRVALRLPEAAGPRHGELGTGPQPLRLLLVGDSATAGVGAAVQREALAGQLSGRLHDRLDRRRLQWRLVARSGVDTAQALEMLDAAWADGGEALRADVAIVGLGVNDVTGQVPIARWLRTLDVLVERLVHRHGARRVVISGLPPVHRFPALPQPLRWYLGACARRYDRALREWARGRSGVLVPVFPPVTDPSMMASDGFHPGPGGYRVWAEALAGVIEQALADDDGASGILADLQRSA